MEALSERDKSIIRHAMYTAARCIEEGSTFLPADATALEALRVAANSIRATSDKQWPNEGVVQ